MTSDNPPATALIHQLDAWIAQGQMQSAIDHWKDEQQRSPALSAHLVTIATLLIRGAISRKLCGKLGG